MLSKRGVSSFMGRREETKDEPRTLYLLGSNNLGSSLNRGTAEKYTLNVFSLSPAAPEPQKTAVARRKGQRSGNRCAHRCSGLESACPPHLIFGSSRTWSDCCAVPCCEQPSTTLVTGRAYSPPCVGVSSPFQHLALRAPACNTLLRHV